jgi:dual 3',5'-cyclic-AMP and -GMP phosphodiesterase 11
MPAEQGGTLGFENNLGCRTSVPLQPSQNQVNYDVEFARMESWLDENPQFAQDYFIRKATRHIVDAWLVSHAHATTPGPNSNNGNDCINSPTHVNNNQQCSSRGGSGATTPVRKISAHEFERGGLLKPIVNTIDGTPTFLSLSPQNETSVYHHLIQSQNGIISNTGPGHGRPQRLSRNELKHLDEKELIFELVSFEKIIIHN